MITLKVEELAPKYKKLAERFRNAQDKGKLKKCLPGILNTFLDQRYSNDPFYFGLTPDKVRSIESNRHNTIDLLFDDIYTSWMHLRFFNDFKELIIRGGPGIYDYVLDDEHCDSSMWHHCFMPNKKMDSALLCISNLYPFIRQTSVQSYDKILTVDEKTLITPSRFPRSSATSIADYLPALDFEIREEILPATEISYILNFLRDQSKVKIHQNSPSVVYMERVDTSKINTKDYQGPKNHRLNIR